MGSNITYLILGVIGLVIGIYLTPTIVGSVVPELAKTNADGALARTILQFVPVAFVVALLALSFGMNLKTAMGSGDATQKPALLIGAVVTLVIGVSLIGVVSSGQTAAITSVTASGSDVGAVTVADAATAMKVAGQLALTKTILQFVTLGYIVSVLAAAFNLANTGMGGSLTRRFRTGEQQVGM